MYCTSRLFIVYHQAYRASVIFRPTFYVGVK
eukprot:COSAG02_NODE_55398_length_290_cov_5.005236_1_plen_30_part_01